MKHTIKIGGMVTLVSISCALGFTGLSTLYAAGPAPLNLSSSNNFTILAKSGVSTTGTTVVVGNIGVSPVAATFITGFGLNLTSESPFSTSPLVTGQVFAPDYANPTPAMLTTAIGDMQTAYTEGSGRTNPTATELGAGNIGGLTITPGLYKWGTGVIIPSDVTLSGGANDVWIFQIAQNLTISSSVKVLLSGGAQASNVFWVVAGQTTLETGSVFNGTILDQTAIVLNTGAKLNGRALAQTAVTLDSNTVSAPTISSIVVTSPVVVTTKEMTVAIPVTIAAAVNSTGISTTLSPIVCTQDVKLCSNGTYVSRVGQNCEFAQCPVINYVQQIPQNTNQTSLFSQQIKSITNNLFKGNRGNNVKLLQDFLISQNKGPAARSLFNNGTTLYFGNLTRSALAEFQAQVGITPPLGNFGIITREYIRTH